MEQGKKLKPYVAVRGNAFRFLQQSLEADMYIPVAAFLRTRQGARVSAQEWQVAGDVV